MRGLKPYLFATITLLIFACGNSENETDPNENDKTSKKKPTLCECAEDFMSWEDKSLDDDQPGMPPRSPLGKRCDELYSEDQMSGEGVLECEFYYYREMTKPDICECASLDSIRFNELDGKEWDGPTAVQAKVCHELYTEEDFKSITKEMCVDSLHPGLWRESDEL